MLNGLIPRSIRRLQEMGYTCWKSESYNAFSGKRQDAFGIFDILAIHPDKVGVLGVQVTSRNSMSARRKKITGSDAYGIWSKAGNGVVIHGWDKPEFRYRLKEEYL